MPGTLFYVDSDSLGIDPVIGTRLMQSYWNSFGERLDGTVTLTVAFINRGVRLTLDDSPILASLRDLETRGCRLLSCGTCLDYFDARERLGVGEVGSIPLLQELLVGADKVVSL